MKRWQNTKKVDREDLLLKNIPCNIFAYDNLKAGYSGYQLIKDYLNDKIPVKTGLLPLSRLHHDKTNLPVLKVHKSMIVFTPERKDTFEDLKKSVEINNSSNIRRELPALEDEKFLEIFGDLGTGHDWDIVEGYVYSVFIDAIGEFIECLDELYSVGKGNLKRFLCPTLAIADKYSLWYNCWVIGTNYEVKEPRNNPKWERK